MSTSSGRMGAISISRREPLLLEVGGGKVLCDGRDEERG
jgi:hypothetical protein